MATPSQIERTKAAAADLIGQIEKLHKRAWRGVRDDQEVDGG